MRTTPSSTPSLGGLARKAQLLDCAVDVLVELGFAGTSVAEVARRAGVSKDVVTYHFPTKEDSLGEVVNSLYREAGEQIGEATGDSDSVIGELATYIRSNLTFVADHPRHVRAVMEVAANMRSADGPPGGEDPLSAHLLGRVSKVPPAWRRLARTLAALSGSPRYIQYRGDPPPCDRTHQTPPGPPFGRTALLSKHALDVLSTEVGCGDSDHRLGILNG
ncbi:TetR/AcrR family transcriptional regulator [Streptomyces sp. NPDC005790]|uniref:TetR/AcrR family transcriptional regulator n=1 Tax=Streptomyces sp. NPDC005790 TaxID=3154777 RepID=UPI0034050E7D